ncbi:MAG: hypothetical protein JO372_11480 [Solirubrobacterales bacterium]|nr:hypothetical protein [Solirubrobacterales bacterium]
MSYLITMATGSDVIPAHSPRPSRPPLLVDHNNHEQPETSLGRHRNGALFDS